MTTAEIFGFEGRQVTAVELAAEFTAYSESWLRDALRAGCNTRQLMWDRAQSKRANSARGAIKGKRARQKNNPMTRQVLYGKRKRKG